RIRVAPIDGPREGGEPWIEFLREQLTQYGFDLSHRDLRVLMFLLGQVPGYFAHHKTMAEALDSSANPIGQALLALRRAGLPSRAALDPTLVQQPTPRLKRT
ncbi:MAG TPA: hypothetical protein VIV60_27605, partial [Polyangiaceae bacterium]